MTKTKTKKNELDCCLTNALATLEAHTKGLTHDLDLETVNLHSLVSNQDQETQSHLSQLGTLIRDLKNDLHTLRTDLIRAKSLAADLKVVADEPALEESAPAEPVEGTSLSAEEASRIRHDEPVTLGTVIRSLLMANEPGQRERRKSLP